MKWIAPFLSRRLLMAVGGIYILRRETWGLFLMLSGYTDPAQITTFQALSLAYLSAIVGIVMWYIGNSTWKGGFSVAAMIQNATSAHAETITQNITETVDERIVEEFSERYAQDKSYRPLDTLPDRDAEEFR